jgi:hypothetical protein
LPINVPAAVKKLAPSCHAHFRLCYCFHTHSQIHKK